MQNGRLINSSGKLYDTGNTVYEVTGKIPVTPGDIYYLSNFGQYCAFYDQNGNYINTTCNASWYSRSYIVIPENVGYISLGNYLWSTDAGYDRSILNGIKFNETGSFNIVFLKLGNLADIYKDKLTQGPSNNNGSSKDKMYANLRVQLKDGVNGYLAKGGSWNLDIYQVANTSGTEVSDEDLMKGHHSTTTSVNIPAGQEVNRCVTIPVTTGNSYKVVLKTMIGSRSVEVGKTYFTVRKDESGTPVPVYGISASQQIQGIRQKPYGDYILNKDVTLGSELSINGGTLYGKLDLQGHTLTNTSLDTIFDAVGSAAKRQGTVYNGTLAVKAIRSTKDIRIIGSNYGTLENINFKIDAQNPYSGSGTDKVYDNSRWASEVYSCMMWYNYGTIQNFTMEYQSDLVGCSRTGFIHDNYGLVQDGYIYGEGALMGGGRVGGIASYNTSKGTIRNIYSTHRCQGERDVITGRQCIDALFSRYYCW